VELDARFHFENYIVGSSNRLAVAAARAVAQSPGTAYNPLFIYSNSGLGKTHLMQAIGHLSRQRQPDLNIEYVTVDEFVEQLHAAVAAGEMQSFKARYQHLDMLMLDDVQFLAGRRETQTEMLRLFNVLQRTGRQILLSSDRPPSEISDLDERLITRFSGGLIVDISQPDYETRVAILRTKSEERGVQFLPGVLEEIARIGFTNVRELQGALNRLIAVKTLGHGEVTVENVRALLGERGISVPPTPSAPVAANKPAEYESFVSDLAGSLALNIEPWRVRIGEAITYWMQLGYRTTMLERVLEVAEEPDVDDLVRRFETAVDRLKLLAREASSMDAPLADGDLFKDPERLDEAEALLARMLGGAEPPPAPSPEFARHNFEMGPSNQLAVHAADAIVDEPGRKYNPLFLHGPTGVGKTHLANAIGNDLIGMSGGASSVACVNAQTFVDELIAALQAGAIGQWRARYRNVDALIIDDVQFCAGKERTQEELFHVFNSLHSAGKQIVLVSDRGPKALEDLEDRLRSRFEGGLVVEMQTPDRALRERLFARFLAAAGATVDRALLEYLAARPASSVREIIGAVNRLTKASDVTGIPLSAQFARQELEGSVPVPALIRPVGGEAMDEFFLDVEKIVWDWPDVSGRAIEELR
jgi:chromosomal replication initiator protein